MTFREDIQQIQNEQKISWKFHTDRFATFDDFYAYVEQMPLVYNDKYNDIYFDEKILVCLQRGGFFTRVTSPIVYVFDLEIMDFLYASVCFNEAWYVIKYTNSKTSRIEISDVKIATIMFKFMIPYIKGFDNYCNPTENYSAKGFHQVSAGEKDTIDIFFKDNSIIEKRITLFTLRKKDYVVVENINHIDSVCQTHSVDREYDSDEFYLHLIPLHGKNITLTFTSLEDAYQFSLELKSRVPHIKYVM